MSLPERGHAADSPECIRVVAVIEHDINITDSVKVVASRVLRVVAKRHQALRRLLARQTLRAARRDCRERVRHIELRNSAERRRDSVDVRDPIFLLTMCLDYPTVS